MTASFIARRAKANVMTLFMSYLRIFQDSRFVATKRKNNYVINILEIFPGELIIEMINL